MRFIKPVLLAFFFFCVLITLISLLMPSTVMVARTVLIDAPPEKVFAAINNMDSWPHWFSPIRDKKDIIVDRSANKIHWGPEADRNTVTRLDSSRFISHFSLEKKNQNTIDLFFSTDSIEAVQSLQLEMRTVRKLKWYPWEKFSGMFEDKISGSTFEETLRSLKSFVESPGN